MTRRGWLAAVRRYLLAATVGHLAWEIAQLPLFTLWTARWRAQLCIVGLAMWRSLPLPSCWHSPVLELRTGRFGVASRWPVSLLCCPVGYTAYSEYLKTVVRQSWAYSPAVPTLLGVGLSPLAQWIIVPVAALARVHRSP